MLVIEGNGPGHRFHAVGEGAAVDEGLDEAVVVLPFHPYVAVFVDMDGGLVAGRYADDAVFVEQAGGGLEQGDGLVCEGILVTEAYGGVRPARQGQLSAAQFLCVEPGDGGKGWRVRQGYRSDLDGHVDRADRLVLREDLERARVVAGLGAFVYVEVDPGQEHHVGRHVGRQAGCL